MIKNNVDFNNKKALVLAIDEKGQDNFVKKSIMEVSDFYDTGITAPPSDVPYFMGIMYARAMISGAVFKYNEQELIAEGIEHPDRYPVIEAVTQLVDLKMKEIKKDEAKNTEKEEKVEAANTSTETVSNDDAKKASFTEPETKFDYDISFDKNVKGLKKIKDVVIKAFAALDNTDVSSKKYKAVCRGIFNITLTEVGGNYIVWIHRDVTDEMVIEVSSSEADHNKKVEEFKKTVAEKKAKDVTAEKESTKA